jgi:HPt (histidine-containing phosphotransfer) domain-containing protein
MAAQNNAQRKLDAKLKTIWQENKNVLAQRIAIVRKACPSAEAGSLTLAERDEAKAAAHKLAGSLGMFGLLDASAYASEIELRLEQMAIGEVIAVRALLESLEQCMNRAFQQ